MYVYTQLLTSVLGAQDPPWPPSESLVTEAVLQAPANNVFCWYNTTLSALGEGCIDGLYKFTLTLTCWSEVPNDTRDEQVE